MSKAMVHLNGNLLCAIDTETTGLSPGFHDLIQVCVLPLDSNLNQLKVINDKPIEPFYLELRPIRPENANSTAMQVNGLRLADLMQHGMEPFKAADLFEEWVKRLDLPFNKRIAPLGQNYTFDKAFLIEWLGDIAYQEFIDYNIRDTQTSALFLNDRAAFHAEAAPFPKVKLKYLASQLDIAHDRGHDALADCLITAQVYQRMMRQSHL